MLLYGEEDTHINHTGLPTRPNLNPGSDGRICRGFLKWRPFSVFKIKP